MKTMAKKLLVMILTLALVAGFAVGLAACNDEGKGDGETLQLYVPDGAPVLAVAQLIAEKDTLTVAGYKVEVNIVPANQIGTHMAKGDGDIVIMPANAGMNLISKGADYEFVCSNTRGILYMISLTEGEVSPADLAGRKVGCIGKGAVPEYAVSKILEANGLAVPEDVEVKYYADGAGVQAALSAGQIDFGIVGEPAATAGASKGFSIVMDIQAEFNAATGSESGFPMSSTFVKGALADKEGFVEALIGVFEDNTDYIAENAADMTALLQGAGSASAYPPASIPRCNVGVYMGEDVTAAIEDMMDFFAQA